MLTRAARKRKNANLTEHLADKTVDLDVSSTIVSSEHSVNSENSAQKEKISMVSSLKCPVCLEVPELDLDQYMDVKMDIFYAKFV